MTCENYTLTWGRGSPEGWGYPKLESRFKAGGVEFFCKMYLFVQDVYNFKTTRVVEARSLVPCIKIMASDKFLHSSVQNMQISDVLMKQLGSFICITPFLKCVMSVP